MAFSSPPDPDEHCVGALRPEQEGLEQVHRLLTALYADGDRFFLGMYREKPQKGRYLSLAVPPFSAARLSWIASVIEHGNSDLNFAVATSLASFSGSRRESDAVAIQALGVDIDPGNFAALKPGATTVEEVLPEVLRRTRDAGLPPHALVHSGHGLHVYWLIERQDLSGSSRRDQIKTIWWRLCHLLGSATDRFDISTVLRLPGTINRKNGDALPVRFIEQHTDLKRLRFNFNEIARAAERVEVPSLKRARPSARAAKASKKYKDVQVRVEPDGPAVLSDDDRRLLDVAGSLDENFLHIRQASALGEDEILAGKRSAVDFRYACKLIEYGFSERVVRARTALAWRRLINISA